MPKILKKLTFQLIGPASIYNVLNYKEESLEEQKSMDTSFIGAMLNNSPPKETSVKFPVQVGSYDEYSCQTHFINNLRYWKDFSTWLELPFDEYFSYAPVVGKMKMQAGNRKCKKPGTENCYSYESLINILFTSIREAVWSVITLAKEKNHKSPYDQLDWTAIEYTIHNDPDIRTRLIYGIVQEIDNSDIKLSVGLPLAKPLLSRLVKCGADYDYYPEGSREHQHFMNLITYGLDGDALNLAVAKLVYEYTDYEKVVRLCVSKGANINMPKYCNEDFGTLLHYDLCYEFDMRPLIRFYESLRSYGPNGEFNYEKKDAYGRTPLLIAIITGNQKVVLELLKLTKNKIKVGIDIPDRNGRTPLLIAAALGMKNIVELLVSLGANRKAIDNHGKDLDYHASLSEAETAEILAPLVHPYRSCGAETSYLYWDDEYSSPVTLTEKGENEKTGDAQKEDLVLLSEHKHHIGKLNEALEIAHQQASENENKRKTYQYFLQQRDKIRGQKILVEACRENQEEVRVYLDTLKKSLFLTSSSLWKPSVVIPTVVGFATIAAVGVSYLLNKKR